MQKTEDQKDRAASEGKRAFFAHLGACHMCKAAWFTPRDKLPNKEALCSEGKELHRVWWAAEEA